MMKVVFQERSVKAITVVLTVCCVYGMFCGVRILWTEPQPSPAGRHTRNLITAEDYVNVFMVVKRPEIGGAIAAIHSILKNTKNPVHFNLATDNRTLNFLWTWIERSVLKEMSYEIKAVNKQWLESQVGLTGNITQLLPYSSIIIHSLFPSLKGNVIVVADDVIVQGDVAELKQLQFEENYLAAFSSNCDTIGRQFKSAQNLYASFVDVRNPVFRGLHLNASACTFASGIYVLNIDTWMHKNVTRDVLHWMNLNKKKKLYKGSGPLPAMMIALFGKVRHLDPLWNVRNLGASPSSRYDLKYLSKAKLLHWNGPFKPWGRRSPYQNLWDKYFIPDPTGQFRPMRNTNTKK